MKLSKAQLQYIDNERAKMDQREEDFKSLGDMIYKSSKLSAELGRIHFRLGLFNFMIELHNVEVEAEKAPFEAFVKEMSK